MTLTMEVVEVSDVDAIALHPMTSLLDLDREVLLPAYEQRAGFGLDDVVDMTRVLADFAATR